MINDDSNIVQKDTGIDDLISEDMAVKKKASTARKQKAGVKSAVTKQKLQDRVAAAAARSYFCVQRTSLTTQSARGSVWPPC